MRESVTDKKCTEVNILHDRRGKRDAKFWREGRKRAAWVHSVVSEQEIM